MRSPRPPTPLPTSPTLLGAACELRALLGEVVDAGWRHPTWWGLALAGAALVRAAARRPGDVPDTTDTEMYSVFLSANGGPRADTFMARDRAPGPDTLATRIARGITRARAAAVAIERLDGTLPGQPLACAMAWKDGWLTRAPLVGPPHAVFVTPRGLVLAPLDLDPTRLAHALADFIAGKPLPSPLTCVDQASREPARATIAVTLADQPLDCARHLHRRAWTAGGGPWLGLGDTERLELVTTCHLAIDGYGHGLISRAVFAAMAEVGVEDRFSAPPADLAFPATAPPPPADHAPADSAPLGFAATTIPAARAAFPRAAYALGRALARFYPTPGSPRTPTFQIPVAPGARIDPTRRRRRVLFALLSLGADESFAEFTPRLARIVERERDAAGILSRLLHATTHAPLPAALRRRLLAARATPHPLIPPIAMLRGRGSLCVLRYPPGERPVPPLYAASQPGLSADAHDPRGAIVITLVHHDEVCTASVAGTGWAGTPAGAGRFLDLWLDELR